MTVKSFLHLTNDLLVTFLAIMVKRLTRKLDSKAFFMR